MRHRRQHVRNPAGMAQPRQGGFGGLPMESGETPLPEMAPGSEESLEIHYKSEVLRRIRVDVMRPTRFSAAATEVMV